MAHEISSNAVEMVGGAQMATKITETRANEIALEVFAGIHQCFTPGVMGGQLTDGAASEPADLSSEEAFRAQCAAWRSNVAADPLHNTTDEEPECFHPEK